jgi:hypothetical protein
MRFPKSTHLLPLLLCVLPACERPASTTENQDASPAANAPASESTNPAPTPVSLPTTITFNEHIQPILSEYCYHCHGPDSGTREPKKSPLRLDREADAFAPRDGGDPVILKGNPKDSLLMQLIHSDDPDAIMPPPKSHKVMSKHEIALLEKWIEQGAEYQDHWAFIPPTRPETPAAGKNWATNPIDHFIAERLESEKLTPNPVEDPRRFYRRLHLDLTGLPPAPADIDAFTQAWKTNPQTAVEAAADTLLASTPAAEHQARIWLDAARYADTHGIHIDNYRAIWPYRDWVIDAFQKNMPWDQFTLEQIAGDLLPSPTLDQIVATGFSRCLPTTGEGGAIGEEYDAIYAKDRVDTVSAIWLGLTTGCASCHDHKFDPISMKDFYSMAAFFRNTTMSSLDGNNANHPPNTFVPLRTDIPRWTAIDSDIKKAETALNDRKSQARPDFETWLANLKPDATTNTPDPSLDIHLPLNEPQGPIQGTAAGKPIQAETAAQRREGPLGSALLANSAITPIGDIGSFSRTDSISFGSLIYIEGTPRGAIAARMDPAQNYRGWDFWIEDGHIGTHIVDTWPASGSKIVAAEPLEPGKWHHVMIVFNGTQPSENTITIFINGKPVQTNAHAKSVGPNLESPVPFRIGSRHGDDSRLTGTVAIQDFRLYRRALSEPEVNALSTNQPLQNLLTIPAAERQPAHIEALYTHYLATIDPPSQQLKTQIATLTKEKTDIQARGSLTLIMQEKPNSEPSAHLLLRGVYSDKGDLVKANTPESLNPLPADAPRTRLGLGKWLTDRKNPLTARVTVNRAWQQFFGTGIVETPDDLGIMGARPSHPKLLDWLAVEFMDSGWDHRKILRLIVTSATYRQAATISPEKLEKDPYNRLIARGPRLRLDAEVLRDMALATSGLLSSTIGGPPVKPYQPEGIWEAVAMKESNTRFYKPDAGESLYRRSVYTFWKRTAPPPSMEILNAPSREVACVRRDRTNTPLQALVMLNDPQFVEASRQLATQAIKASTDDNARIDHLTLALLGRTLADDERAIITQTLNQARTTFTAKPDDAKALILLGATPPDPSLPAPDLATWTLTASQILNLDETLTR